MYKYTSKYVVDYNYIYDISIKSTEIILESINVKINSNTLM